MIHSIKRLQQAFFQIGSVAIFNSIGNNSGYFIHPDEILKYLWNMNPIGSIGNFTSIGNNSQTTSLIPMKYWRCYGVKPFSVTAKFCTDVCHSKVITSTFPIFSDKALNLQNLSHIKRVSSNIFFHDQKVLLWLLFGFYMTVSVYHFHQDN